MSWSGRADSIPLLVAAHRLTAPAELRAVHPTLTEEGIFAGHSSRSRRRGRYLSQSLGPSRWRRTRLSRRRSNVSAIAKTAPTLLVELLRTMSVEAYPALANTDLREELGELLPFCLRLRSRDREGDLRRAAPIGLTRRGPIRAARSRPRSSRAWAGRWSFPQLASAESVPDPAWAESPIRRRINRRRGRWIRDAACDDDLPRIACRPHAGKNGVYDAIGDEPRLRELL